MNHGYCKNCWWWLADQKPCYGVVNGRICRISPEKGKCYMQNSDEGSFKITGGNAYCPDYVNRKKEEKKNGTLEEWIRSA